MDAAQRIAGAIGDFAGNVATSLPGQIVDVFLFVLALYFGLRDSTSHSSVYASRACARRGTQ